MLWAEPVVSADPAPVLSARPAVRTAVGLVVGALLVGAATGLVAGYQGGWFDAVVMRLWDTLLAFPAIFLAIKVAEVLQFALGGKDKLGAVRRWRLARMANDRRHDRSAWLASQQRLPETF